MDEHGDEHEQQHPQSSKLIVKALEMEVNHNNKDINDNDNERTTTEAETEPSHISHSNTNSIMIDTEFDIESDEFREAATRATNLVIFSSISTLFIVLFYTFIGDWIVAFDCFTNIFCMYLTFVFSEKAYQWLCYRSQIHHFCFHICVRKCFAFCDSKICECECGCGCRDH